jgi:hypothetical protein
VSEELETRLSEALGARAEIGITHTDTGRELRRLQAGIGRERRRRRMGMGFSVAAAAALIAGAVGLAVELAGGHETARVVNQPTAHRTASASASPRTATVPAGFPVGSWAKVGQQFHERLIFSDAAVVTLQDSRGMSSERLSFPARGEATFSAGVNNEFCGTSGTYRYAVTGHRLHFTLVGKDACQSRVDYLTGSAWKFIG